MKMELLTYQNPCSVNIFSHLVPTDITSDKSQPVKALEAPLNDNSHKTPVTWYKINQNRVQVNRACTTNIFFSCGCRNPLELATGDISLSHLEHFSGDISFQLFSCYFAIRPQKLL